MQATSEKVGRIIVTRTDRLGDLLMALPVLAYLKKNVPHRLSLWARAEPVAAISPLLKSWGVEWVSSGETLGRENFFAALALYDDPKVLKTLKKVGIPLRVGLYSRFLSFLLLNKGSWQHRSRAEKNESVYNLELAKILLRELGVERDSPPEAISIPVDPAALSEAKERVGSQRYLVIHPGMGGSAENLSAERYLDIVKALNEKFQLRLWISEGPNERDREVVSHLARALPQAEVLRGLSLAVFREVLRESSGVIAPSTGPLHLAHYVGAPVFGLFPNRRNESSKRWCPMGGSGTVRVAEPPAGQSMEAHDWAGLILDWGNDLKWPLKQ